MQNKIFHVVKISMEEQDVEIYPNETFDGIILATKELEESNTSRLYLNTDEMQLLILKMTEMMRYVQDKQAKADGTSKIH
jgi:hypothetical protein